MAADEVVVSNISQCLLNWNHWGKSFSHLIFIKSCISSEEMNSLIFMNLVSHVPHLDDSFILAAKNHIDKVTTYFNKH